MKLWAKQDLDVLSEDWTRQVEDFTTTEDKQFDLLLAPYDIAGSIAHARMLGETGIISLEEQIGLVAALEAIGLDIKRGQFSIRDEAEDVHTEIELRLTELLGETGKKIHTGRSRNDQSLLNIKLFLRDQLQYTAREAKALAELLLEKALLHKNDLLPGYTHYQVAMPSSVALWLGAYAEALAEDIEGLELAYRQINRNPLGSAAGYGSSFPVDRELTTRLLEMNEPHISAVYAQMTRGRHEKMLAEHLGRIAGTIGRLSADMILYLSQEFGFISFPDALTTGSSIMPHKKNPDVLELIRARCNQFNVIPGSFSQLLANLPSGYHRDMQLTKALLFPAIPHLQQSLRMMQLMLANMSVKQNLMEDEKYRYAFSVDRVNTWVQSGLSFREAYRKVGREIASGNFEKPEHLNHTHLGSTGNPGLEVIGKRLQECSNWLSLIPQPIA